MLEFTREGMLNLTRDLVRIRSVSHTSGENEAADAIFSLLAKEDYFREHPEFLRFLPVEEVVFANRIIRPAYKYLGVRQKYKPIEER